MNEKTKIIAWIIGALLAMAIMYTMLGGVSNHIQTGLERTQAGIQHARVENERAGAINQRIERSIVEIERTKGDIGNTVDEIKRTSDAVESVTTGLDDILRKDRASLANIRAIIERVEEESGKGQESQ